MPPGLGDAKRTESAATAKSIEDADGFAQVFPEHKFHIVDVLQQRGHIVGMTGDGVNDAPALKKADCGIAVSGATDAARAAASIVLTTPGLSVIIDAIKESRKIFQRMNSYAIYRIAETLRVLVFVTLVILIFNFFPVTAIQIVMLALLNDGAILSIAYDNVRYKDQPEAWNMRLVLGMATVLGVRRADRCLWPVLPRRPCLPPRPSRAPDDDVPDAVGRWASDDLSRSHARPVLVDTPGAGALARGARDADTGDSHRGLWAVHDAPQLALRRTRVGLCARMVPRHRSSQTARLPDPRSGSRFADGDDAAVSRRSGQRDRRSGTERLAAIGADATRAAVPHRHRPEEDPVYHDNSECPYGQEITRNSNSQPGKDGRRRCDWCTEHAGHPAPLHTQSAENMTACSVVRSAIVPERMDRGELNREVGA